MILRPWVVWLARRRGYVLVRHGHAVAINGELCISSIRLREQQDVPEFARRLYVGSLPPLIALD